MQSETVKLLRYLSPNLLGIVLFVIVAVLDAQYRENRDPYLGGLFLFPPPRAEWIAYGYPVVVEYRHVEPTRFPEALPPETTVTIYCERLALLMSVLFVVTAAIGHRLAVPHGNAAFLLGVAAACVATYGAACWQYAHNTDPFYWAGLWSEVRAWASLNVGVPIVLATLVVVGVMKSRHRAALQAPGFEVLRPTRI